VMDVLAYNPTIVPWTQKDSDVEWDPDNDWGLEEEEEDMDPELMERLSKAARVPRWGVFHKGPFVHVAFDGGARAGVGSAGYVIADVDG